MIVDGKEWKKRESMDDYVRGGLRLRKLHVSWELWVEDSGVSIVGRNPEDCVRVAKSLKNDLLESL